ncbi:ArnT family glycosyltransferase [Sulfuricystis thermophila]|uniref:ArnT family glycosyltransferase n=1 Tax=Sulfuricystis thermophila TaxID=2496847 RepID=UPI0010356D5B|nr:glycosyltransferase family 39 protein [Sulfuricystis thermophila]
MQTTTNTPPFEPSEHKSTHREGGEGGRPFLLLLLCAAGLSFFVGLSATPLIDLDEGAFTAATQEMFARGDFLATYLNGEPRYDKPILIYWLQAAAVAFLGFSEFALRLPSALMGLTSMLFAWHFARRLFDAETAAFAALVTATAMGPALVGRLAIADALLDASLAAAVFWQYLWLREGRPRDLFIAWAAMGFGFLAKGPVAVILPLAALFLHCAASRRWRDFFVFVTRWRAWLLWAAIALPWYVAVTWVKGPGFVESFFLRHNVGRFSGAMGSHHAYGLLYYLPVALLVTLPYTGLLFSVGTRLRALWRDDFARYALILFALVFVLFSLSVNKLPHYLLYGTAALWVLLGRALRAARSPWLLLPALVMFVGALFVPDLLEALRPRANPYYQTMFIDLDAHFGLGYRLPLLAATLLVAVMMIERRVTVSVKLAVTGVIAAYCLSWVFLSALGGVLQQPIKQAGLIAREIDAPLVMSGLNTPSFGVYAGRVVERRLPRAGDVVLTRADQLAALPSHELLYRSKTIALVRILP